MGCDVAECPEEELYRTIKVHRLMCVEMKKLIQRISHIVSEIESARPGCQSGIQALCSFHTAMDKAKLLIQYCSECSKLYLAITGDSVQSRFERARNSLEHWLSQIQNIVPPLLAEKISGIIHDLRNAKFPLEPSEYEAGQCVLALLRQDLSASGSMNQLELEALQLAALRLNITSRLALLIEKRSIKRQLDKFSDTHSINKKVLNYLLYLLRKYKELMWPKKMESTLALHEESYKQSIKTESPLKNVYGDAQVLESGTLEAPEEFKCPISMRLMYDPVVITSGETFERVWIEKWINEGHNTCPKTHVKLDNLSLIPNLTVKELISKWCLEHGISISEPHTVPALCFSWKTSPYSIASFGTSIDNLCLQVSNVSLHSSDTDHSSGFLNDKTDDSSGRVLPQVDADSHRKQSLVTRDGTSLTILSSLAVRPWGLQCDVLGNFMKQLRDNKQSCQLAFSYGYMKPLIKFLKDAHGLSDVKAQKDGAELLLAVLSYSRDEMPTFNEDEFYVLVSFLESGITQKALKIIEVVSCQECYKSGLVSSGILPSLLKVLDTEIREFHELSIRILFNLCGNNDIVYHIVYLDCIPKLVRFLEDAVLVGYCLKIVKALCSYEEARTAVAETNLRIGSIAKLLETGTKEDQEYIVDILLSLCYEQAKYCELVMTENMIQSLVNISVNGSSRGKEAAKKLLLLLQQNTDINSSKCSTAPSLSSETTHDSGRHYKDKNKPSKSFGFMSKILSRFMHSNH